MNIILAAAVTAAGLVAGCAKQPPADPTALPAATEAVTGYASENGVVTLLNGQAPVASLPFPDDADRAYVVHVPEAIRNEVMAFIAESPTEFTIVAARPYGKILLLDVEPKGKDDGNVHIVYDLKRAIVVGRFSWYPQG